MLSFPIELNFKITSVASTFNQLALVVSRENSSKSVTMSEGEVKSLKLELNIGPSKKFPTNWICLKNLLQSTRKVTRSLFSSGTQLFPLWVSKVKFSTCKMSTLWEGCQCTLFEWVMNSWTFEVTINSAENYLNKRLLMHSLLL